MLPQVRQPNVPANRHTVAIVVGHIEALLGQSLGQLLFVRLFGHAFREQQHSVAKIGGRFDATVCNAGVQLKAG